MTLESVLLVAGAAIPSIIGWLVIRSVKGVDTSLAALTGKVDQLSKTDTQILISLAELRVRVTHLEHLVIKRDPQ